jgi:agmatine deiminase
MTTTETPAAHGFRMPAEWEPHAATWLAWPHRESDWPGKLPVIPWVYGEIVRALTRHEPVNLIVPEAADRDYAAEATDILTRAGADAGRVTLWKFPTDRSWVRDSGPIFVVNDRGERAVLDWHFNAWAKYPDWTHDDRIPRAVAQKYGLPRWQPQCRGWRVVLEGGAIDVNGRGTLLATEECLLDRVQERNPCVSREELEGALAEHLGARHVLWLGRGVAGDDTHGHVDDIVRFVDERTVVAAVEDDPRDPNHEPLRENLDRLAHMVDQDGAPLRVVPLPMPSPVHFAGQRLPASYANFYVGNEVVLVPTFNDPRDRRALEVLAAHFPDRRVVGIHAVDLVLGLGTLHCMTQQEPA